MCRECSLDPLPKLVIAGKRGWLYEDTLKTAETSSAREQIIFTGYVPDKELPALYSDARCFVYPSYFEGFGIPALEAMRCGTPTITANRTCFPEVVGDAALMVDPFDEQAIAAALLRILSDKQLREELMAKGLKRAAQFDWKITARQTLAVYESVYAKNSNKSAATKTDVAIR
jgi:glycosyltransferase involved in cell wall biosynthesis